MAKEELKTTGVPTFTLTADDPAAIGCLKNYAKLLTDSGQVAVARAKLKEFQDYHKAKEKSSADDAD